MADSTQDSSTSTVDALNRELSGYRVLRQVGHGAMGVVFQAEQQALGRMVAIKVLPTSLSMRKRTVKRFLREAEAMGRLAHENIVAVHDVGSIRNLHYFCMTFVQGPPLDVVLKAGPLAINDVLQIGIDVGRALAHAHSRGVIHRDVKPSNLLRDGERVVLTDFGLARPLDTEDTGSMTESGDLVGTPLYMAPEQISGDTQNTDGRADVWGLGVTMFELLTQRAPFSGPNAQGILHSILHKDPPLLRKLRDDVPGEFEAVVLKCLEKDPARRYSGAAALVKDLEAVRDGRSVSAARPHFYDPALRWTRRNPFEAGVVGVAVLLAAIFAVALQQFKGQLFDREEQLVEAQLKTHQAQQDKVAAEHDTRAAAARYELSEARVQFARAETEGRDDQKQEAVERLFDVLESLPEDEYDDIRIEICELMANWMKQFDGEQRVLDYVDSLEAGASPERLLAFRAAALTGLGRFQQALLVHRERVRLEPKNPLPFIDSARVWQLMAEEAVDRMIASRVLDVAVPDEIAGALRARPEIPSALRLHRKAIELAVAAADPSLLVTVLVERAGCYVAIGDFDSALGDLSLALGQDPSRLDAHSLLSRCVRLRSAVEAETEGLSVPPEAPDEGLLAAPVRAIGEFLPGPATLDTRDLESAGRGLQSIYRGLHSLLRDAATPDVAGGDPGEEPPAEPTREPAVRPKAP